MNPMDAMPFAGLVDLQPTRSQVMAEVLAGLQARPQRLPSRLFYDAEGSALFEAITQTPEYYLTRTERGLLERHLPEIAVRVGPQAHVVELGSGSGSKTRLLLQALQAPVAYTPVEISRQALLDSLQQLVPLFPQVQMLPLCADFTRPFTVPRPAHQAVRRLAFFPGSTLGNFVARDAVEVLSAIAAVIADNGLALIGVDLHQDAARIEAAYNDDQGVTAAFTLNLLRRLNRELGSDFDLDGFAHHARYDQAQRRIHTQLVSRRPQQVHLAGQTFVFDSGQAIDVEFSHKYSRQSLQQLAAEAGLEIAGWWTSTAPDFALCLLAPVSSRRIEPL